MMVCTSERVINTEMAAVGEKLFLVGKEKKFSKWILFSAVFTQQKFVSLTYHNTKFMV